MRRCHWTALYALSDYIAELIKRVPSVPEWLDGEYASPLVGRVAAMRDDIRKRAYTGHPHPFPNPKKGKET